MASQKWVFCFVSDFYARNQNLKKKQENEQNGKTCFHAFHSAIKTFPNG